MTKLQSPLPDATSFLDPEDPLYKRALQELGIDNPVYYCKVVGSALHFHLVGGDVAVWPPRAIGGRDPGRRIPGMRNRVSPRNPVSERPGG